LEDAEEQPQQTLRAAEVADPWREKGVRLSLVHPLFLTEFGRH
jgi:hypothetical protein